MGTRPKDPTEMQRKNRRLGDVFRRTLDCPLCKEGSDARIGESTLRVVAYRANTVRMECPRCGLRFSMAVDNALDAYDRLGGFT